MLLSRTTLNNIKKNQLIWIRQSSGSRHPYRSISVKNWAHKDFLNSIHFNDTSFWEEAGSVRHTVPCVTNRLYAVIPRGTDRHSACFLLNSLCNRVSSGQRKLGNPGKVWEVWKKSEKNTMHLPRTIRKLLQKEMMEGASLTVWEKSLLRMVCMTWNT